MTRPEIKGLAGRVKRWQRVHGRHGLPWQGTRDPYRVWLSEVMLQQTQVATASPYYERFIERFADVHALAAAPLDDVLALWSGLGYYSRARNLHRCAQAVVAQWGGAFPATAEQLATLPGIGRSTAAAIAAFCFGQRVAILDGNVKRVLTRVLGFDADLAQASHEAQLWRQAEQLLPLRGVDVYTQGLMDLGATLCSRRQPDCQRCPLAGDCVANQQGEPERYPVKTRRLKRGRRGHALLWLTRGNLVWLTQRPERGVWAGLWSLPEFATPAALLALTDGWPGAAVELPTIEHALTHFDWSLKPIKHELPAKLAAARLAAIEQLLGAGEWVKLEQVLRKGLPAPIRRLLEV